MHQIGAGAGDGLSASLTSRALGAAATCENKIEAAEMRASAKVTLPRSCSCPPLTYKPLPTASQPTFFSSLTTILYITSLHHLDFSTSIL